MVFLILISYYFNIISFIIDFFNLIEQDGTLTRGRKRTRTFFNSIKRKLSGTILQDIILPKIVIYLFLATRSSSSVIHNANAVDVTNMRSASENRNDTAISRPSKFDPIMEVELKALETKLNPFRTNLETLLILFHGSIDSLIH